jgi:nitrate/nitrite transporter NarK
MAIVVGLAVINSVTNLAGYFAPQLLGYLKGRTGKYATGLTLIAVVELLAPILVLLFISRDKGKGALKT